MAWEHYDEALKVIGGVGPFQIRLFFGASVSVGFSLAFHLFAHVFTGKCVHIISHQSVIAMKACNHRLFMIKSITYMYISLHDTKL